MQFGLGGRAQSSGSASLSADVGANAELTRGSDSEGSDMPIVFEEVTGEIVPERGPAQAEAGGESPPGGTDVGETVRREIYLMRERERRLHAD